MSFQIKSSVCDTRPAFLCMYLVLDRNQHPQFCVFLLFRQEFCLPMCERTRTRAGRAVSHLEQHPGGVTHLSNMICHLHNISWSRRVTRAEEGGRSAEKCQGWTNRTLVRPKERHKSMKTEAIMNDSLTHWLTDSHENFMQLHAWSSSEKGKKKTPPDILTVGGLDEVITVWIHPDISHLLVAVGGNQREDFLCYSSASGGS